MRSLQYLRNRSALLGAAGLASLLAACAGGGGGVTASGQPGAQPQGVAYVPQSAISTTTQSVGSLAPPPLASVPLDTAKNTLLPNLTKPIINDSGSFPGGPIIVGTNTGSTGSGIEGVSNAVGGYGVVGLSETTTGGGGLNVGVYGKALAPGAYGVYGYSSKADAVYGNSTSWIGVYGVTAAASQYGGYFTNASSSASASALKATSNGNTIVGASTNGYGLMGSSANASGILGQSGNGFFVNGVVGTTASNFEQGGSAGVLGQDNTTCNCVNYGVSGTSGSIGYGVFGNAGGVGVEGQTGSGAALEGFSSGSGGLALHLDESTGGTIMTATNSGSDVMSMDGSGNMILSGNLTVDGFLFSSVGGAGNCSPCPSPLISTRGGRAQVENVGDGQLADGHAYVGLDSAFAAQLDSAQPYHVFVTPEGDSNGLYVTGLTRAGFTVHENHNGRSTVAFSYRIVGTPRQVRLQRPHGTPASLLRLDERAAHMQRPPPVPRSR